MLDQFVIKSRVELGESDDVLAKTFEKRSFSGNLNDFENFIFDFINDAVKLGKPCIGLRIEIETQE